MTHAHGPLLRRLPVITVLLLGLLVSASSAHFMRHDLAAEADQRFVHEVALAANEARSRLHEPLGVVMGLQGILAAAAGGDTASVARYAERAARTLPLHGVQVLGALTLPTQGSLGIQTYAHLIALSDEAHFSRLLADASLPGAVVRALAHAGQPLLHKLPPYEGNQRPVWLMLVAAPVAGNEGANEGANEGVITADKGSGRGSRNTRGAAGAARSVLYAQLAMDDMLLDTAALQIDSPLLRLADDLQQPAATAAKDAGVRTETRAIEFPGHRVQLVASMRAGDRDTVRQWSPGIVGFIGSMSSICLALLVAALSGGRARAEALARIMTADLERLALVAKRTSNSVVITDRDRRITWVNEGFTRLSGYAVDTVLGRSPGALLQSERTDPATVARIRQALDQGEPISVDIENQHREGHHYWLHMNIQPLHDEAGVPTGYMAIQTDVTAAKLAQATIEQARREIERLAKVAELTSDAVIVTDREHRIVWVNAAFTRIYGLSVVRIIGRPAAEVLRNDSADAEVAANMREAMQAQRACRVEIGHRTEDGRFLWLDVEVQPAHDQAGAAAGYIGVVRDITAYREATTALALQRQRLVDVVDSTRTGTWQWDMETQATVVDERWAGMLGYTVAQLMPLNGPTVMAMVHPDDQGPATLKLQAYLRGQSDHYDAEVRMRHARGHWVWVHNRAKFFGQNAKGRATRMTGTLMDISARKRAEAEIRRLESVLRGALEAVDEAFVVYDPNDRIVYCNEKYRRLQGAAADLAVPGVSMEALLRGAIERGEFPGARDRVDAFVAQRLQEHRTSGRMAIRHQDDGSVLRVIRHRMADGHTAGFLIDITELVQAKDAAETAARARSQFLAMMSHEIRTPMNAILGLLTLLRRSGLDARQADYAAKTDTAARSLLGLLNDILDYSKVEAGKLTLDAKPMALESLLKDLAVILAGNVGDKPVDLVYALDPQLPAVVVADSMRLRQVLINLGGNALKFTARGEVALEMKLLGQQTGSARLLVAVRDSGIGIAPEHQQRIFEGFTQAEASTTRHYGGTSLGLAISQRLVALMGGELRVESTPGKGSRFSFELTLPVPETFEGAAVGRLCRRSPPAAGPPSADVPDADVPDADVPDANEAVAAWLVKPVTPAALLHALRPAKPAHALATAAPDASGVTQAAPGDAAADDANATATVASEATEGRLQGLRLLVVEDNTINPHVDRELLEDEGAIVQMAADGRQGVDAVLAAQPGIDAVLMDLQMPVLDGLAATASIGKADQPPVSACTADQFDDDRLHALIAPACEAGVDLAAALVRMGGHGDTFAQVLSMFISDAPPMIDEAAGLMAQARHADAGRVLHTLKGLAAMVGAEALRGNSAAAEHGALAKDTDFDALMAAVRVELQRVMVPIAAVARQIERLSETQTQAQREAKNEAQIGSNI